MGQRRLDRVRRRRKEGSEVGDVEKEEEIERFVDTLNNLRIKTAGTEEEAAEQLTAALEMEVKDEGEGW